MIQIHFYLSSKSDATTSDFMTLSLLSSPPTPSTGWSKASLSVDASEENDGYSSSEDPMNSDPEDEVGKKLVSFPYVFIVEKTYACRNDPGACDDVCHLSLTDL